MSHPRRDNDPTEPPYIAANLHARCTRGTPTAPPMPTRQWPKITYSPPSPAEKHAAATNHQNGTALPPRAGPNNRSLTTPERENFCSTIEFEKIRQNSESWPHGMITSPGKCPLRRRLLGLSSSPRYRWTEVSAGDRDCTPTPSRKIGFAPGE